MIFLCNVFVSMSITYLDSLSSKKNMILVCFFLNFLKSKVYFCLLHNVTELYVGQSNGVRFSASMGCQSQVLTFYQAAVQCQVRWACFRLESSFDV